MKKKMLAFTLLLLALCFGCFTGCGKGSYNNSATHPGGNSGSDADKDSNKDSASGGVLHLKGDSEFAITYDKDGRVTDVTARNEKGKDVLTNFKDFVGKETREVVSGLTTAMGEAGHFTAETADETKQLSLEIQKDSVLPHDSFLDDLVDDVRTSINTGKWNVPLTVSGASHFGLSDDKYNNSATDPNGTDNTNAGDRNNQNSNDNTSTGDRNNQNNNGNTGTGDRNNQNRDDDYDDGIFDDDRYDDWDDSNDLMDDDMYESPDRDDDLFDDDLFDDDMTNDRNNNQNNNNTAR